METCSHKTMLKEWDILYMHMAVQSVVLNVIQFSVLCTQTSSLSMPHMLALAFEFK